MDVHPSTLDSGLGFISFIPQPWCFVFSMAVKFSKALIWPWPQNGTFLGSNATAPSQRCTVLGVCNFSLYPVALESMAVSWGSGGVLHLDVWLQSEADLNCGISAIF